MAPALLNSLGGSLLDAGVASAVLLSASTLVVAACRQPARRIRLSRLAFLSSAAVIPWILISSPANRVHFTAGLVQTLAPDIPARATILFLLPRIALVLASVACGLAFTSIVLTAWAVHRLIARTRPPRTATQTMLQQIANPRRPPALRVSGDVGGPMLIGFVRPTIVIPAALEDANTPALPIALRHEWIHARHGDSRWSYVSALSQCLWFFVPAVVWLRRQMNIDQEYLADHASAQTNATPSEYAAELLNATLPIQPVQPSGVGAPAKRTRRRPLIARISMLLHSPVPIEPHPPASWICLAIASFTTAVLALGHVAASGVPLPFDAAPKPPPTAPYSARFATVVVSAPDLPRAAPAANTLLAHLPPRFECTLLISRESLRRANLQLFGISVTAPARSAPEDAPQNLAQVSLQRCGAELHGHIDGRPFQARSPTASDFDNLTLAAARDSLVTLHALTLRESSCPRHPPAEALRPCVDTGRKSQ